MIGTLEREVSNRGYSLSGRTADGTGRVAFVRWCARRCSDQRCASCVGGHGRPDHRCGQRSLAVSSDGTHVWVANQAGDTVTELDASTGIVQTIGVAPRPGVSSDGTHVWVTNYGDAR